MVEIHAMNTGHEAIDVLRHYLIGTPWNLWTLQERRTIENHHAVTALIFMSITALNFVVASKLANQCKRLGELAVKPST